MKQPAKHPVKWMAALLTFAVLYSGSLPAHAHVAADQPSAAQPKRTGDSDLLTLRYDLIQEISELTQVPWSYLAAMDQYERTITPKQKKDKEKGQSGGNKLIGFRPASEFWAGELNPDQADTHPVTIAMFGGYGRDGSGDKQADPANDQDLLYTMALYLKQSGLSEDDLQIAVWHYYHNERAVNRITQFAKIYQTFNKLDLFDSAFVLPLSSSYSYRSTWGDRRGFGGLRIHEGTDLFASYGVPVRSACYGIVETKGWNRFGGWRVGIRDLNNRYHYYAHLQGFDKKLKIGDTVVPGQVVGWVGSSGYGSPGTQGKFPPHLHYGIYRDTGFVEWAFDPYPLLRQWEIAERRSK